MPTPSTAPDVVGSGSGPGTPAAGEAPDAHRAWPGGEAMTFRRIAPDFRAQDVAPAGAGFVAIWNEPRGGRHLTVNDGINVRLGADDPLFDGVTLQQVVWGRNGPVFIGCRRMPDDSCAGPISFARVGSRSDARTVLRGHTREREVAGIGAWRTARLDPSNDAVVIDVVRMGTTLVAIGGVGAGEGAAGIPVVWVSFDGLDWQQTKLPVERSDGVAIVEAVATTGSGLVAVGSHEARAAIWESKDGVNWSAWFDVVEGRAAAVAADAGQVLVLGEVRAATGDQRTGWTRAKVGSGWATGGPRGLAPDLPGAFAGGPGGWAVLGSYTESFALSRDGITWARAQTGFQQVMAAAATRSGIVVAADDGLWAIRVGERAPAMLAGLPAQATMPTFIEKGAARLPAPPRADALTAAADHRGDSLLLFGDADGRGRLHVDVLALTADESGRWAWSRTSDVRTGILEPQAIRGADGFTYIVGLDADGRTGALGRYDSRTGGWRRLAPPPTARSDAAFFLGADGLLYLAGGRPVDCCRPGQRPVLTDFARYDPKTNRWTRLAPIPVPDGVMSGASVRAGEVWLFTPWRAWRYDARANAWTAGPATPSFAGTRAAVASGDGFIRLFTCSRMETFHPEMNHWAFGMDLVVDRCDPLAVRLASGQIVVVGGIGDTDTGRIVESYSIGGG